MNDNQYQDENTQDSSLTDPAFGQSQASSHDEYVGLPDSTQPIPQELQQQISSLPSEANDLDLIEKEWVTHLKYIVDKTKEDPFTQQAEISKAKADYMRKRYNKDVKVSKG